MRPLCLVQRRACAAAVLAVVLLAAAAAAAVPPPTLGGRAQPAAAQQPQLSPAAYAPGWLIVKLRPPVGAGPSAAAAAGNSAAGQLSAARHGVVLAQPLALLAGGVGRRLAAASGSHSSAPGVYSITDGSSVAHKVAQLQVLPGAHAGWHRAAGAVD